MLFVLLKSFMWNIINRISITHRPNWWTFMFKATRQTQVIVIVGKHTFDHGRYCIQAGPCIPFSNTVEKCGWMKMHFMQLCLIVSSLFFNQSSPPPAFLFSFKYSNTNSNKAIWWWKNIDLMENSKKIRYKNNHPMNCICKLISIHHSRF